MDDWMQRLTEGIAAGYYHIEDASAGLTPLPREVTHSHYVMVDRWQLARGILTPPDTGASITMDACRDVALDCLAMEVRIAWDWEFEKQNVGRSPVSALLWQRVIVLSPALAGERPRWVRRVIGGMLGCIAMQSQAWAVGHAWDVGRHADVRKAM